MAAVRILPLFFLGVIPCVWLVPQAQATPTNWVEDESSYICDALALDYKEGKHDWATIEIGTLQTKYGISRADAVSGMYEAAQSYCPSYISAVPTR